MYLVAAWMATSTPCASGWKKIGDAQVLSINTVAPCALAARVIAGFQEGHQRSGNGAKPARERHGAISALKLGNRLLEGAGGRRAFTAVGDTLERAAGAIDARGKQGLE